MNKIEENSNNNSELTGKNIELQNQGFNNVLSGLAKGLRSNIAAALMVVAPLAIPTATSVAPIVASSPAYADNYKNHCHKIDNFSGRLQDGRLVKHNFAVPPGGEPPYAIEYEGMIWVCFFYPGDENHKQHWQGNLLGPSAFYAKGTHDIDSDDINECPAVNPCK